MPTLLEVRPLLDPLGTAVYRMASRLFPGLHSLYLLTMAAPISSLPNHVSEPQATAVLACTLDSSSFQ